MNHQQIIDLASECKLLYITDLHPKSNPVQQRLISKLEKFADAIKQVTAQEIDEAYETLRELSQESKSKNEKEPS